MNSRDILKVGSALGLCLFFAWRLVADQPRESAESSTVSETTGPPAPLKPEELRGMPSVGLRAHAWNTVAKITADKDGVPLWERWDSKCQVLDPDRKPESWASALRESAQLYSERLPAVGGERSSVDVGHLIRTSVRFNDIATEDIRDPSAPLYMDRTLVGLVVARSADNRIAPFRDGAMSAKAVWWPVKFRTAGSPLPGTPGMQPSVVPVWDGNAVARVDWGIGASPDKEYGNDFTRWTRKIGVDPRRAVPPWQDKLDFLDWSWIPPRKDSRELNIYSIDRFFAHQFKAGEQIPPEVQQLFSSVWDQPAQEGDGLLLVALHVAAKEDGRWTWITLWWHDSLPGDVDRANAGVAAPWNNYLMNVVRLESDSDTVSLGRPVFNPWLEAPMRNGLVSNCITCHRHATWDTQSSSAHRRAIAQIVRAALPEKSFLLGKVQLDEVWSLARLHPCSP